MTGENLKTPPRDGAALLRAYRFSILIVLSVRVLCLVKSTLAQLGRVLSRRDNTRAPRLLRIASRWRYLRRLPARIIGVGFRPEHVKVPAPR